MDSWPKLLVLLLVCTAALTATAQQQDAAALLALRNEMKNTPPSWGQTSDPCGAPVWDGITCNNSRVIGLKLYNMGLEGTLSSDIGSLSELQTLNLAYNNKLGGPLPTALGNLKQLNTLILIDCSFNGSIPDVLGNMTQLSYLALNSNNFTGTIPASLGNLVNLFWLDLAENQLTGPLPISTNTTPGFDQLFKAKHFHLNQNQLSGPIPEKLFSSNLIAVHVLLDRNQFTGRIPDSIGLVQTLKIIRLDNNSLSGPVPSSINNLTQLNVLNLANNKLTGQMPNLTGMNSLNSVDLSNNSFDPSEAPSWISELQSLRSLAIESGGLHGEVPQKLFSFPELQQVILRNNAFNGSLDMGSNISKQLQLVDLQNNSFTSVALSSSYNNSIILIENPVCANVHLSGTSYCLQEQSSSPFSANLTDCDPESCSQNISCSHPYEGVMIYRAPFFQDVTNQTVFKALEKTIYDKFGSSVGSVYLQNPYFDSNSYLRVELKLCPLTGTYFNRTQILIELDLGSQNYNTTPEIFGPYYFSASKYNFQGKGSSLSTGVTIGAVVGCTLLILGLVGVGIYALRQKKQVQRANEIINPFASWVRSGEDGGAAPQLKGARWFSYDEIRKCTNNFPEINVIGSGGYGKVYRGMLLNGQVVAIKRSQVGSNQGALEFKTEIELLSRVHHKNLVELVGFCFQQGERMVVYEYIPNGTLRESLSGKRGIQLDWKRRLRIALGSARGIAYLHELANPPIIHRDIKSTNILLDEKLNAKVADFGLSKLVSESEAENGSTDVKGTLGYLDPEYYMTQQLSEKSDVYSFGVVMLELVTATPPIHNGQYIVREVKMAIDENDDEYFGLKKIMDPVIQDARDLTGFRRFVELAIQCVEESSLNRPTMSDIVKEIEMILRSDGLDINSVTASSPDRDFGISYNGSHYPYNDPLRPKDVSSSSFEFSGGSIFSLKVEPK